MARAAGGNGFPGAAAVAAPPRSVEIGGIVRRPMDTLRDRVLEYATARRREVPLGRACQKGDTLATPQLLRADRAPRGSVTGVTAPAPADTPATPVTAPTVIGDESLRDFEPERLDPHLDVHAVDPGGPLWDTAERFVYDVFRVSGFCGESPRGVVEETEPWRAGSRLHVITESSSVVGVARTVIGRYDDLPVSQFDPEVEVPGGLLCEIGSLAVRPTQRGLGVANELHRRAFREGFDRGVEGFCFLVDQWMFDFFRDHYGLPVRALAPPRRFMGGDVVPTGMWMPEMLHVIARIRPNVYRWSVEGLSPHVFDELDLPVALP